MLPDKLVIAGIIVLIFDDWQFYLAKTKVGSEFLGPNIYVKEHFYFQPNLFEEFSKC